MFWDDKSKVFRKLKQILRELEKVDSEIKKRKFEQAFKELRKGFLDNERFIKWLEEHHSSRIDSKNLTYGSENVEHLFSRVSNMLMEVRSNLNKRNYAEVLTLIKKMEKLVIWEIKADKRFIKQNLELIQSSQGGVINSIKEADRILVRIIDKYGLDDPVNFISITNKDSEKKKFLEYFYKGEIYNPRFSYKAIPENVLSKAQKEAENVMGQLRSFKMDFTKGAAYLIEKKRFNLQIILKLIRSIGTNKITKYSMQLYGFPSYDLIRKSYRALEYGKKEVGQKLNTKLDEGKYSAKDFKKRADLFFKNNNMGWKTVIKTKRDMDGRAKTVNSRRELWINSDSEPFSERDIIKIIEHEIRVHAFRLESGRKSPLKILAYGTSGYLPTEEGLTTYFEDLKNAKNPILGKKKYLYVITEFLAAKGGFYHCFSTLTKYGIEPDTAWDVVVRIKRGLSNTGQPGGFFKDHVYFLGDKLIKEFIASGGRAEELMGGKVGIGDVRYLIGKYRL